MGRDRRFDDGEGDDDHDDDKENSTAAGKRKKTGKTESAVSAATSITGPRDFFGRVLVNEARPGSSSAAKPGTATERAAAARKAGDRVWISFHEGFSNAVRKPISLREFWESF
jgi:hypothetical protein